MTERDPVISTMRTVRFHEYGEPADVRPESLTRLREATNR
jgi:hypothetical protein